MESRPRETATAIDASPRWGGLEHASTIRAAVFGIWAVIILNTPYQSYAAFPVDSLRSVGLMSLLLDLTATRTFVLMPVPLAVVQWGTCAACIVAMLLPGLGRLPPWCALAGVLLLDTLTKSVGGFANHAQAVALLVLALFAIFSGRHYLPAYTLVMWRRRQPAQLDAAAPDYAGIVWLCSFVIVVPYTYIGLNRLLVGGAEIFRGDAILYYLQTSASFVSPPMWMNDHPWRDLLRWGFLGTTCFEASSLAVLAFPRYRAVWLIAVLAFHLATLVLMNILFWENMVLAGATFWWGWHAPTQIAENAPATPAAPACATGIG